MLTRITPSFAVAYWTSAHSARFGLHTPDAVALAQAAGEHPAGEGSTAASNSA